MHEYPIAMQLIKIVEKHKKENNLSKIEAINLVVGEYSGYIADSVKLYFDILSEGTQCYGSELNIEYIKPELKCEKCEKLFLRKPFCFDCPYCGGQGRPTEIGREFYIKSIEGN